MNAILPIHRTDGCSNDCAKTIERTIERTIGKTIVKKRVEVHLRKSSHLNLKKLSCLILKKPRCSSLKMLNAAFLSLLLLIALVGCASRKVSDPTAARSRIFPNGIYQHDVDLTMQMPPNPESGDQATETKAERLAPRTVHFHGVVKISDSEINLAALSPLNSTLFKIHEDRRTGQVSTDIYVDALKKVKRQMTDFYALIRLILTVPVDAKKNPEFHAKEMVDGPTKGLVDQLSLHTDAGPALIKFRDYDKNKIPETILVENTKFSLEIKVSGYEI